MIISDATSYDLLANESLDGHAHLSSQILRVECLALDSRTQRLTLLPLQSQGERCGGAYGEWDGQKMAAPEGCLPPSNSKGQATEQRESSFPCHVPSPVQLKVAKAPCPCSIKGLQKLERVTTADVHRILVTAGF